MSARHPSPNLKYPSLKAVGPQGNYSKLGSGRNEQGEVLQDTYCKTGVMGAVRKSCTNLALLPSPTIKANGTPSGETEDENNKQLQ